MANRVLSVHQEHELLLRLEQAGLSGTGAQAVIESKGNALAKELIGVIHRGGVEGNFFPFTTSVLTPNELWERNQNLFYHEEGLDRWWKDEPFANKKGRFGKFLLRTTVALGSFNKTWNEQQRLLSEGEYVPTLRELFEGMIAYYRATGEWLFFGCWVRSQDVSSKKGYRLAVGLCSDRLYVRPYWDGHRLSFIGLAVARR